MADRGLDDGTIAHPTKINLKKKINCIFLFYIFKKYFLLKLQIFK